jgi:membrane-bound ClpP family serine protease
MNLDYLIKNLNYDYIFFLYIIFIIWKFKLFLLYQAYILNNILKEHNTMVICDISKKIEYIYNFMNIGIFDIDNNDVIISHLINNNIENIIIDTDGGSVIASDRLITYITASKLKLNTYVIRKAYSAGTVLALAGNKIYMDNDACLSPTDPQITLNDNTISAKDLIDLYKTKDINSIDDNYIVGHYNLKKMFKENVHLIKKLLKGKIINETKKTKIINKLTDGTISHHMPFNCRYLKKYLDIETEIPEYIYIIYNSLSKIN